MCVSYKRTLYLIITIKVILRSNKHKVGTYKNVKPADLFAPVLSLESDVQQLSIVDVVHKCFSFLVFVQYIPWLLRVSIIQQTNPKDEFD